MAAPNTMHNLTTLIKRLEAATSRLEDIATSTELPKDVPALSKPATSSPDTTLAASGPPCGPTQPPLEPLPESIDEFDLFLGSTLDKYVSLSMQLGGLVAQQSAEVLKGFKEQRKFLLVTTRAAKPPLPVYQNLLKPINEALMAVIDLKESNRPDPMYTQLSAVADGIRMLAWVTVDGRPYKHVDECLGSAQFFGNRVLQEQRDKDPKQVKWIQSFYQIFRDLAGYIRHYFPSGITWNARGESAEDVFKALGSSTLAISDIPPPAPPPPPPPGLPPVLDIRTEPAPAAPSSRAGGFNAVFSELNKGAAVTKSLRKVDQSEMTHKNPSLRAGSAVTDNSIPPARAKSPAPGKKPKPESMRIKKPAKKELEGNKWTIENFDKEPHPVEIEASLAQSVLISRCKNTTVIIKGKANQVTVENSSRLSLVVDTLVSTVDVVKAQSFALQVLGSIPTVLLDQIDGAQIYLSKESSAAKLFASKSDGINLNVMTGPDGDYREVPLPSQICSYYDEAKGDLVNEIVAHAG